MLGGAIQNGIALAQDTMRTKSLRTLTIEGNASFQLSTLKSLWPYLWPEGRRDLKSRFVLSVVLLLLSKLSNLAVPFLFKYVVDALYPGQEVCWWVIGAAIVGYGLCRLLAQALNEVKDFIFAHITQNAGRIMGLETFNKLQRLGLNFHLERKTGYITRIIERGNAALESFLRFATFNIIPTFTEVLLVSFTLWIVYNAKYAGIVFGTLAFYVLFTLFFTEWRTTFVKKMNQLDSEANAKAIDSLLNYETIKYFGAEAHESQRYQGALQSYQKAALKSAATLALLNTVQGLIISVGLIILMLLAALDIKEKILSPGDFVLLMTCLMQLYTPLNILGFAYREMKLALLNMETLFKTLREPESIYDRPHAPALVIQQGQVDFENVCFSYNPQRQILDHLSFTLKAGQTVAIVGPSGAGKSTLARLLFRFYDPQQGRILIDGQDIAMVTQQSLRAHIGMVPQDTVLFNDTIFYNIAYGRWNASWAEVEKVAHLANIHGFIEKLPQGYDTVVGERGLKLSGGEKQRIAIARTLLKDPAILIFDEATSALDTHTEQDIQRSIFQIAKNRTTLIIAHRLSTIVEADSILVIDQGRIMEAGNHHDLMKKQGLYYNLWSKQTTSTGILP